MTEKHKNQAGGEPFGRAVQNCLQRYESMADHPVKCQNH